MQVVTRYIRSFWREEDAPTMAEYGLLLALIAIVVIAAAFLLGSGVSDVFDTAAQSVGAV